MHYKYYQFIASNFILLFCIQNVTNDQFCYAEDNYCEDDTENARYLLYDVNPPEGFNLRRDVYMRYAILARELQQSKSSKLRNFRLVLPPWSHLYHWKYDDESEQLPWSTFFDLPSLKAFAPVIEMYEFFEAQKEKSGVIFIDEVYTLQHFKNMFETGIFENKLEVDECQKEYIVNFFYYENVTSVTANCLSFHGPATELIQLFLQTNSSKIFINHAEVALHDRFGDKLYWEVRRSMRFNRGLRNISNEFRNKFLNSNDVSDNTITLPDWRNEKPHRNAIGGSYLAIHLRRRDFVTNRPNETPKIDDVIIQVTRWLRVLNLTTIFVATDAPEKEYKLLESLLPKNYTMIKYTPSKNVQSKYKDGGIAIIEQIICSHARHFIGTAESTFTFRIQEEREILGFPIKSTFNVFCVGATTCKRPPIWKIEY